MNFIVDLKEIGTERFVCGVLCVDYCVGKCTFF